MTKTSETILTFLHISCITQVLQTEKAWKIKKKLASLIMLKISLKKKHLINVALSYNSHPWAESWHAWKHGLHWGLCCLCDR